jgi:hypothetical protein
MCITLLYRADIPSHGGERKTSTQPIGNSWYSSVLVVNIVQILNISNLYMSDLKYNTIIAKLLLAWRLLHSLHGLAIFTRMKPNDVYFTGFVIVRLIAQGPFHRLSVRLKSI